MADPVTKTIDGHEYEVRPFMGLKGWRLQVRLASIAGPAVSKALSALPQGGGSVLDADIDLGVIGGAVEALVMAIAENDPNGELIAELLETTSRDNLPLTRGNIDKVYAANYAELIKAVMAVVQANGFFGIGDTGFRGVLESVRSFQKSPETSAKS